jgi:16S rRNA (guanine1207-N2)-methyltransferase
VLERRFVLAHALRTLAPGGVLTALAPRNQGGARLRRELEAFGCGVSETARRHHRICATARPEAPVGLEAAIAAGGPQLAPDLGLWSQPGVFSWNRVDAGTALLASRVGDLAGRGADLGCGVGVLARFVLASPAVETLALIDLDARAVAAARRNLDDPRARFLQADARALPPELTGLDFVVTNPPFHDGGREDADLGRAFIGAAAAILRPGGVCRLVANIALAYERTLAASFKSVKLLEQGRGYKIYEARR